MPGPGRGCSSSLGGPSFPRGGPGGPAPRGAQMGHHCSALPCSALPAELAPTGGIAAAGRRDPRQPLTRPGAGESTQQGCALQSAAAISTSHGCHRPATALVFLAGAPVQICHSPLAKALLGSLSLVSGQIPHLPVALLSSSLWHMQPTLSKDRSGHLCSPCCLCFLHAPNASELEPWTTCGASPCRSCHGPAVGKASLHQSRKIWVGEEPLSLAHCLSKVTES